MKTAEQWQKELGGESSLEAYRSIQHDALVWVLLQIAPDENPECARRKILEKINTL